MPTIHRYLATHHIDVAGYFHPLESYMRWSNVIYWRHCRNTPPCWRYT